MVYLKPTIISNCFKKLLHRNFTENHEKVLSLIKSNNGITTGEIASKIGLSRRAVQTIINLFKSKGILIRVGSDRRDYWQIVEKGKKNRS